MRPGAAVGWLPSACLVARVDRLRAAGGFAEDMRVGEDVDLVWRLVDAGLSQREAAAELGVSQQAVHSRLRHGLWNETRLALDGLLPLLAGENVGSRFVVPTVAGSIDLVVHAVLERDGTRRVREICAVPGRTEGDVVEIADLFVDRGGRLVRADGFPPHPERFERAGYDLVSLLGGGRE